MRKFQLDKIPRPSSEKLAPEVDFDLEIGCGVGLHSISRAIEFPHEQLVAIERTRNKFEKFQRRLDHHPQITNLTAVHDDAHIWIPHRVSNKSIKNIFILYPNPELKNKNQRLPFMPFLDLLREKMRDDGKIIMATNIKQYRDECFETLPSRGFKLLEESYPSLPGRTHFEKKYLLRGEVCYQLEFGKLI